MCKVIVGGLMESNSGSKGMRGFEVMVKMRNVEMEDDLQMLRNTGSNAQIQRLRLLVPLPTPIC